MEGYDFLVHAIGTEFMVRLLNVFSKASVMITSPLTAWTSSFKFLLIKVINVLNLTDSCYRQMSTASGFFLSDNVLLITAGTFNINYSTICIVLEVSLLIAYCGSRSIMLYNAYLAILNK